MDYRQPSQQLTFKCIPFDQLDSVTLYEMLALRLAVFSVEQNCPYQDLDGKDISAWHLLGYQDGKLVAVARLLMPDVSYSGACSVGRVCCHIDYRDQKVGQRLMAEAVKQCRTLFSGFPITISAQHYLVRFYQQFGFQTVGSTYLEDDILHIEMTHQAA
ncbi:GNAT family N-acetyltransferase [Reinekea thalattae]|nr:GNAT family N-acetyltransferase [Reinekea thalattae]